MNYYLVYPERNIGNIVLGVLNHINIKFIRLLFTTPRKYYALNT